MCVCVCVCVCVWLHTHLSLTQKPDRLYEHVDGPSDGLPSRPPPAPGPRVHLSHRGIHPRLTLGSFGEIPGASWDKERSRDLTLIMSMRLVRKNIFWGGESGHFGLCCDTALRVCVEAAFYTTGIRRCVVYGGRVSLLLVRG